MFSISHTFSSIFFANDHLDSDDFERLVFFF